MELNYLRHQHKPSGDPLRSVVSFFGILYLPLSVALVVTFFLSLNAHLSLSLTLINVSLFPTLSVSTLSVLCLILSLYLDVNTGCLEDWPRAEDISCINKYLTHAVVILTTVVTGPLRLLY